ncbi:uncharacterized protein NECHADRAFT_56630, partial [Fusarium vanettenii 77-13-4]
IASIIGTNVSFITGKSLADVSVALKISWLSRGVTKRVKDVIYCILRIFSINMPFLYSKGINIFVCL